VVADVRQGVLRTYSSGGALVASSAFKQTTALDGPRLARAPDGSFYATLPADCAIAHLGPSGQPLGWIGNCAARDYLDLPGALLVDPAGKLYVGEVKQHVVKVLDT